MSSDSLALQDAFISYGRADSKAFARKLNACLVEQNLEVWFDFDDIPLGVDYQNQIDDGIERSQNFLFVISPHSVNSPYCQLEVEHALHLGKRIIPLLHVENIERDTWQARNPHGVEADWQDYQAKGLHSIFPNMHPIISKINWVYFREGIDDFQVSLQGLLDIFKRQQDYVRDHTILLAKALNWQRHQKQAQYLLMGASRQQAERWLGRKFDSLEQSPCEPTELQCEFICDSIKNANGLMTDVFLSYSEKDRALMDRLRLSLMREGFTTWINRTDIRVGGNFQTAINKGIEEANYMVYLISPDSLASQYCQQELDYARTLNKKVIPLLMRPMDLNQMPDQLRSIQFINFVNPGDEDGSAYRKDVAKLVKLLQEDSDYYHQHKHLLARSLKWQRNEQNSSLLLRSHNLRSAEAWLKVARKHGEHGALASQVDLIQESLRQPPNQSIDVFISYSRADADFARQLNEELQVHGKTTWFDQESIAAGSADFQEEIFNGIESADHFLFIISPDAIKSPYCGEEVNHAHSLNKRTLTVLHRPVDTKELPPALASVQWIDFNSKKQTNFQTNLSTLLRALESDPAYLRSHTRLLVQALDWEDKARDESLLLRGKVRTETETWLLEAEGKTPQPTRLQQDFVTASAAAEIRRQRSAIRMQRIFMGLISLVSLVAIGLGLFANQQRVKADKSEKEANTQRELAQEQQKKAESQTVLAQTETSLALFASHQPFEALLEAMRAGVAIKNNQRTDTDIAQVVTTLQQAVFWVQERNRLDGHEGIIWDVAVSKDGKTIASASADGTARLWNINGQPLATFVVDDTQVLSVALSPDGKRLAMGLENNQIQIRQLGKESRLLATLEGHEGPITSLAFSPDGRILASASEDKNIRLWKQDGTLLKELTQHIAAVRTVIFSPNGKLLASGGDDRTIRLYMADGKPFKTMRGHRAEVKGLAFSPDGTKLASASWDETIRLWSTSTGQSIREIRGHNALVYDVSFSPDGQFLASGSWDKTVRTWTLAGEPIATVFGHSAQIHRVHFNREGLLISGGGDRTIRLWKLDRPLINALPDHQANVYSVVFSPDDKVIASSGADNNIRLWDRKGNPIKTLSGHNGVVWELSYSPDGQTLASVSTDQTVKLWTPRGQLLATLQGHKGPVYGVTFSADGEFIATGAGDRTVHIWRKDGTLVTKIVDIPKDVLSLAFSPDNKTLATSGWDHFVSLWDIDGKLGEKAVQQQGKVYEIIYDLEDKINHTDRFEGQAPRKLEGHRGWVHDVIYSPDGTKIATASADGTAKLWSRAGNLLNTLEGHRDGVVSIQFSHAQGDLIATGSYDHTVKLWSSSTGALLTTLRGHQDRVTNLSMSRDKQLMATVGEDDRLLLWDLDLDISEGQTELLDGLLDQSCSWLGDYLKHHAENLDTIRGYCKAITASTDASGS